MAIYVYDPSITYGLATPDAVAKRGILPGRVPINVGTDGILIPVAIDTNLFFGGTAGVSVAVDIFPAGGLILDGAEAPVNVTLSGTTTFDYVAEGTLLFGGEAPVTVLADGTIVYTYIPHTQPVIFGGDTDDTGFTLNYEVIEGGIIFNGEAQDIRFITGTVSKGGSGVLRRPKRIKAFTQPTVTIWEPSIYAKDAPIGFSGGSADYEFVDGKAFKFITTLPKVEKPVDRSKSFIKSLPKRSPVVSEFISPGASISAMEGEAVVEFYDHGLRLSQEDDVLIGMLMEDDVQPVVAVAYDDQLNKIRKDDEAVLEKLLF